MSAWSVKGYLAPKLLEICTLAAYDSDPYG